MNWIKRCRTTPYAHQIEGVEKLLTNPVFALFDEVGAGKSKQIVDAACALFEGGVIDTLLVVCPGFARSVWSDPDPVLGEVAKHAWDWRMTTISEYHRKTKHLPLGCSLQVVVTNYEFIRREERLTPLIEWANSHRVWLVLDESWMVKNHKSQQAKACFKLRQVCDRVTLLNGTPGDPQELYSQFAILNKNILGFTNFWTFRARHAVMGGFMHKQIVSWQHMEEFRAKIAPYALRRLTRDCFDLPPVTRTQIEARLTPPRWATYKTMRDEMVVWLSTEEASIAGQAGVKALRLAQILAGFLGGVESMTDEPELIPEVYVEGTMPLMPVSGVREIGREKLDALLAWLEQWWPEASEPRKVLVWGRFRAEIERTALALQSAYPSADTRKLYGGQDAVERAEIKQLLAPGGHPAASIVVGSPAAGGAGLNLAAANVAIYLTNTFSLKDRLQSEGRIDRPGQTRPILYLDVIATGPDGQKTLDHHVLAALRKKQDLAAWTADVWRKVLTEE